MIDRDSISSDNPEIDVQRGFASPARDYLENFIDLNKELVKHPVSTFYGRAVSDNMSDSGVNEGDILVIDRALEPQEGNLVVAFLDGEFILKRIYFHTPPVRKIKNMAKPLSSYNLLSKKEIWLVSDKEEIIPIHITEGNDFTIWGVVTYTIKKMIR